MTVKKKKKKKKKKSKLVECCTGQVIWGNLFQLEIKIVYERKVNCMVIVSVIIKKKFGFSSNTYVL